MASHNEPRDMRRKDKRLAKERVADFSRAYRSRPCHDCGVHHPWWVMQLDHRPGTEKRCDPSSCKSVASYVREAEKCDVVCANCHLTREHYRRVAGVDRSGRQRASHPELPF